jgi:hypothetical protein
LLFKKLCQPGPFIPTTAEMETIEIYRIFGFLDLHRRCLAVIRKSKQARNAIDFERRAPAGKRFA